MLKKATAFFQHLPRDSRDTLFLLLVVAWILMPQIGNLPWWCSALAGAVLLWRGWLALGSHALPGKFWLLGLLALTVAATLLTHRTLLGKEAGVTMIVVLLTLKTLELRAKRDAFVIFFLGFFSMLTNFFYSQSLLTAFSMLLGLLGLLTVLVNAHMPAGKPSLLEAAKTAGWMATLGAPIMLVLFLLFPRLAPLWGMPADTATGRSGLSASMQIGNIAALALDDSVAMRVRFQGDPPPQRDMYFRGPVLSSFDGSEWRPSRYLSSSRYALTASLVVSGAPINYEVTLEPTNRTWLLVMDAAPQSPLLPGYTSTMGPDLQWQTNRPVTELVRYRVQSYPVFKHGPEQRALGLQEFLDLPASFNPRTLALASEMRRDPRYANADASVLVQAVMERLRTGGYTYTLEPGTYGPNAADEFWFDRKEGFCEHISSAFVILMRALDIPARVVTGYQGGDRNPVDGYWIVRQSDAHAWTEVWEAGRGWVRVDPTSAVAPGRIGGLQRLVAPRSVMAQAINTLSPALAPQFRASWEAINNRWNQWVLNYSQSRQFDLLKNIGFTSPSWEDLSYVLIAVIVFVSLSGALWAWWDRTQHDPWLRLLSRARHELETRGIEAPASTTPRQLALKLAEGYGTAAKAACDWLMALELQRYATNRSPDQTQQLQKLRKELGQLRWPT